ncbi:phage holin family protein [Xiamenia xianingshaonis]|uniref:Holin n=1 Tax=Xiamenia xianingshaonis TaxID=2682776 RepID=A0A9E6SUV8_9ACTN|nr:phage holin family protein [Xiamenia xianingshaonis]NHM14436.1 holin [Xiamenia xianingshaonis]QTU84910.1 phage holin family protein [Xiamenia xianingshaonis]
MDWTVLQAPVLAGVMMVLDVCVGLAGAIRRKDVRSGKLRDGLWHKAGFVGLVALAYVIQYAAQFVELGFEVPTVIAVCAYVILTEMVSVFENLCVLNPALAGSPLGALLAHTDKAGIVEATPGRGGAAEASVEGGGAAGALGEPDGKGGE